MGGKSSKQVVIEIGELKRKLFDLSMKNSMGQLVDTSQIRKTRKQIARLLTVGADKNGGIK